MPFISILKESFATAPIENRQAIVDKLATANTEDANYYQGLILLQKIYDQVMKHEEPVTPRQASETEKELSKQMKDLLAKFDNYSERSQELSARFYLLIYPFETSSSIEFIKKNLHLEMLDNKKPAATQEQDNLPTTEATNRFTAPCKLDPALIDGKNLIKESFKEFLSSTSYSMLDIETLSFPHIVADSNLWESLSQNEQIGLLKKLVYTPSEHAFGSDVMHRLAKLWKEQPPESNWELEYLPFYNFTLNQLDQLIQEIPEIVFLHETFIMAYLEKLIPAQYYSLDSISFWDDDSNVLNGYLHRLNTFAEKLPSIYFNVNAAIKFHKLRMDIVRQEFCEERLINYMSISSNNNNAQVLSPVPSRSGAFGFNDDNNNNSSSLSVNTSISLPLLGQCVISDSDKRLVVKEYLTGLVAHDKLAATIESLGAYLDYHNILKPMFAEIMLTTKLDTNNQESWAKSLGTNAYESLVSKSFVSFTSSTINTSVKRKPSDVIKLQIKTKNISRLAIRVFQIDTENYWRIHLNDDSVSANSNINLDGLCPTFEKDMDYSSDPAILVKISEFEFGQNGLASDVFEGRGLWVVEFVGGQNQCRVIVQKGYLRHIMQETSAGHVAKILDENNQILNNAKIWYNNQYYEADDSDNILIPYLPHDGNSTAGKIILVSASDNFCEPANFYHANEQYILEASFYVNPEMTNVNKKATVVVVPKLTINGLTAPLSFLQENLILSVDCTNASDVKTSSTCQNIESNPSYISFDFIVPEQLTLIEFHLKGKVKGIDGIVHDIEANRNISFDAEVNDSSIPCSIQLEKSANNYFIHVFGKNGEFKKDYEVSLRFKHAFVNRTIDVLLKTNKEGIIELGDLKDIQWLDFANSSYFNYRQWNLRDDARSALPPAICVSAEKDFKIACPTNLPESLYSLYEIGIRSMLIKDISCKVQKEDGYITVAGLSEGEYMLYIPTSSGSMEHIKCTVIQSQVDNSNQALWSNWLLGETKCGKQNGSVLKKPLTISSKFISDDLIQLQIENGSPSKAFVVVTTSTFIPTFNDTLMSQLFDSRPLPRPISQQNDTLGSRSIFLDDKRIGEEYQYILNRSRAEKWVGSNLAKPSLLMYPKKNAATASNVRHLERVAALSDMARKNKMMNLIARGERLSAIGADCKMARSNGGDMIDSSLAFLDHQSPILIFSVPGDGRIDIDRHSLGYGGKFLQTVVISGEQTAYQQAVIENTNSLKYKDLRQNESSNKALIRSKVISKVLPNNSLSLNTHEYETIDSFEKLFDTIKTISNVGEEFAQKFYFLKSWLGLDLACKLELHDKHVCHELNLWLKKKDSEFFDVYVKPAIQSKIQKSFMDLYLLDQDLSLYQQNLYQFNQLNMVEKAFFATTQSKEFMQIVARSFKESFDDKKLDNRSDSIFDSILAHSAATIPEVTTSEYNELQTETIATTISAPPPSAPYAFSAPSTRMAPRMLASGAGHSNFNTVSPQYNPTSPSYSPTSPGNVYQDDESEDDNNENEAEETIKELREKAKEQHKKVAYKYTESTSEWVETGYFYKEQTPLKQFWIDYLEHHINSQSSHDYFLSENFIYCLDSQAELFYVLTLMDLPFASNIDWKIDASGNKDSQSSLVISASAQPLMVFYRTLTENQGNFTSNNNHNLMLGQEIFVFDSAASIDSEECIKLNPATQTLESSVEYGSHLIISNVSSKSLTCQVTVQIPTGSVPTQSTTYCKSTTIFIEPYSTWHEVVGTFYFPNAGDFAIVPVTVSTSSGDKLIGMIDATSIRVTEQSSAVDSTESNSNDATSTPQSWSAIANNSSNEQVIGFLNSYRKLDKLDFSLISWRMGNQEFARSVFDTLKSRYFFSQDIWKYGVSHQFNDIIRDLLLFQSNDLLNKVGQVFDSPLVVNNQLEQHELLIFDYYPLLNARAHPLKPTPEVLNRQFYQQYNKFLEYLSLKSNAPSDSDLIILALYLLLQDRIGEAQTTFARIQNNVNHTHQVQFDYLDAYLKTRIPVTSDQEQMQQLDLQSIKEITIKYKDFGVTKWRQLFMNLHDFVCEVEQGSLAMSDNSLQNNRILSEPILEFEVDQRNDELVVQYSNIKSIKIKYYDMNIEVMFSNNPFMNSSGDKATSENFNWIKPSYTVTVDLPDQKISSEEQTQDEDFDIIGVGQVNALQTFKIPFNGGNKNVFVEISSGSIKRRQAYYANHLYTHVSESFGVVRVMSEKSKRPLAGVYVKVYARLKQGGAIHFWKDGYTGLNGVFDYIGVTEGNQLMGSNQKLKDLMIEKVDKLSVLILSAEEGATVKEVLPPNSSL